MQRVGRRKVIPRGPGTGEETTELLLPMFPGQDDGIPSYAKAMQEDTTKLGIPSPALNFGNEEDV